ncbi:A disintegrin and metalloproteinase with thrombospondin motifs like [Macrobrachium nipponense]|uniref:A disintegrin and metalloproteinase with thrombospondin motifs like n=1 Tax=Macrobrachium nipponense TaxID=159736 RepID=UPI0030C8B23D
MAIKSLLMCHQATLAEQGIMQRTAAALITLFLVAYSDASVIKELTTGEDRAQVQLSRNRLFSDAIDLKVEAFGEEYSLRLLPATSVLVEDFRMQRATRSKEGHLIIEDLRVGRPNCVYQDTALQASLIVEGNTVDGFITSNIAFRPNPDGTHVAYQPYFQPFPKSWNATADYMKVPENLIEPRNVIADLRADGTVYPEIYVLVDSTISSLLGDHGKIQDYLSVFWNAVNQRYAGLKDPQMRLRLAGALIIDTPADEPFITNNILSKDYISGEGTLDSLGDWLYTRAQLPKYDIAYLMTGRNMATVDSGVIQDGLAGISWQGGACLISDEMQRSFNTAMGEDVGAVYSGVLTAAHEVAHTLGVPHDGVDGAEGCPWEDGYIMSYVAGKSNKLFFSPCSQSLMRSYLASAEADCLWEKTSVDAITLSNKLPGDIITLDGQCQKITGNSTAYASKSVSDDSLCVQLVCQWQEKKGNSVYVYTQSSGQPAAEGSACRGGGRCLNGKCQ